MRRIFCAALLAITLAAPAHAQRASLEEIAEVVRSDLAPIMSNPTATYMFLRLQFGARLDDAKLEIYRQYISSLVLNPAFHLHVARMMEPVYRPGMPTSERATFVKLALSGIHTLGMARVSFPQQERFVAATARFVMALRPDQCVAALRGDFSSAALSPEQRRWLASLPTVDFRSIMRIFTDAARAELAQSPPVPYLTDVQREQAQAAYVDTVSARVPDIESALRGALAGGPQVARACRVLSDSLSAMLDMPPPYRYWQLAIHTQGQRAARTARPTRPAPPSRSEKNRGG